MLSPKRLVSLIGQQHPFHSSFIFFLVFCTSLFCFLPSIHHTNCGLEPISLLPSLEWSYQLVLLGLFQFSCMHFPYLCHSRSSSKTHSLTESHDFCLEMSWVVYWALSMETLGQQLHFLHCSNVKPQKYGSINLHAKSPSSSANKYNSIKKRVWGS